MSQNKQYYLVPGRLTGEQETNMQSELLGSPILGPADMFARMVGIVGTPIQPCADVETVGAIRDCVPLVRRTDMDAQIAQVKAEKGSVTSPSVYEYHTADVGAPDGPPCVRFDQMFDEGDSFEVRQRVLRYLGIESRIVEDEWEESSEGDSLDRATVGALPVPDFVPGSQWKLVSAWDTEDGTIMREYTRPLASEERLA